MTTTNKKNKTLEKMSEVAQKVISLIDSKELLPWDQGFVPGAIVNSGLMNHITNRPYNGANLMVLLWLSIAQLGENFCGEYMTVAAAKTKYGADTFPKKGSKTIPIFYPCFYNETEKRYWKTGDDERDKQFIGMRYWNVLPIESFQKFDSGEIVSNSRKVVRRDASTIEEIEGFLKKFAEATNLKVTNPKVAVNACYRPDYHETVISDVALYSSDARYYATVFHEFTHSTAKAMKRKTGTKNEIELYSAEELVAEFGSLFLCEYFGINKESKIQDTATYIDGWKKYLADNPQTLITGINAAIRAVNYMLEKGGLPKLSEQEDSSSSEEQIEEKKKIA